MVNSPDALDEVRSTRVERDAALALVDQKTEAWKAAIRQAAANGVPRTEIVKAAGVNRARVYAILDETKGEG
ncbi:hypothetical protein [Kribbella sp. NBC_00359]|uniref:hypothetical protein n=1 Tax=Kribbella sp. NBC_00359 TaxID=2975966 RepID=UPI002E1CF174